MGESAGLTKMPHLTMLAAKFSVQFVNPWLLWDALDCSTDLDLDANGDFEKAFASLMSRKFRGCSDWFRKNLAEIGIQEPIVVIIRSDGRWQMDEGHHRLANALAAYEDVPVVFDDTGADDDSMMCYAVSRDDVEAYHDTTQADVEDWNKFLADGGDEPPLIPTPRVA